MADTTDSTKSDNPALKKVNDELDVLKDQLKVHKEAKPVSKACVDIAEYSERENEPFSTITDEPNEWHKSEGGGCIII